MGRSRISALGLLAGLFWSLLAESWCLLGPWLVCLGQEALMVPDVLLLGHASLVLAVR